MTNPSVPLHMERLPSLAELFKLFNAGKHLNKLSSPALWAELEKEQTPYESIFASLGYHLQMDGRGFAWFHFDTANSNVNAVTRQLALLFMLLFEHKADAGQHLARFTDWLIDRSVLAALMERSQELMQAEELDEQKLSSLLERAVSYGFAETVSGGWRLLPAVWRYLDHFESMAAVDTTEDPSAEDSDDSDVLDEQDDEGEQA